MQPMTDCCYIERDRHTIIRACDPSYIYLLYSVIDVMVVHVLLSFNNNYTLISISYMYMTSDVAGTRPEGHRPEGSSAYKQQHPKLEVTVAGWFRAWPVVSLGPN